MLRSRISLTYFSILFSSLLPLATFIIFRGRKFSLSLSFFLSLWFFFLIISFKRRKKQGKERGREKKNEMKNEERRNIIKFFGLISFPLFLFFPLSSLSLSLCYNEKERKRKKKRAKERAIKSKKEESFFHPHFHSILLLSSFDQIWGRENIFLLFLSFSLFLLLSFESVTLRVWYKKKNFIRKMESKRRRRR